MKNVLSSAYFLREAASFLAVFCDIMFNCLAELEHKWYVCIAANQSLTENLGPNGWIGRRQQKLSTITN